MRGTKSAPENVVIFQMTVFQKILYELATKNVVPKLALVNTIDATSYTIYQQIKRAREQKLIREVSYKNTYGRKQSTIDCLVLTPAGVKYIRDNLSDEIPWAEYISTTFDSVSILSDFPNKKKIVGRFSKITAAAFMADNIGANESQIYYADFAQSELDQNAEGKQSEKPVPKIEEVQNDEDAFMDYDDNISINWGMREYEIPLTRMDFSGIIRPNRNLVLDWPLCRCEECSYEIHQAQY